MSLFANVVLFGCIPFVLTMFAIFPSKRALIVSMVLTWLFLPNNGYVVPGLPDYTKVSAATFGVALGALIFDSSRVFSLRFRWYDLPMLVWCLGHFPTAAANGLPFYDGFSETVKQITYWGIPYFMGRLYLSDPEGQRDMAMGLVWGGLIYAPFCLYEIRFSPMLQYHLYGFKFFYEGPRYGLGYRPIVFMQTGLETGLWMCLTALICYWAWRTKARQGIWGVRLGLITLGLVVVAVLCKSVGSIMLLAVGIATLELTRWTKSPIPTLVLLLVPPSYVITRSTGLWSGRSLVDLTRKFDTDRAWSLEFRLNNEDILIAKAMERPLLGWGGWGRNRVFVDNKDVSVTDGLWIIALGVQGLVGLAAITLVQLLPGALLLRRRPVRTWTDPEVAPSAVFAILIGLYAVDNLSNAMFNPVYVLVIGGLTGLSAARTRSSLASGARDDRLRARLLRESGRLDESEAVLVGSVAVAESQAADPTPSPETLEAVAAGHAELGELYLETGHVETAEKCLRRAVEVRQVLAEARAGDPDPLRQLAEALEGLGRFLRAEGRFEESSDVWEQSLAIRERLVRQFPGIGTLVREWADGRNDLAWLLANGARPGTDDARRAADLAAAAASLDPTHHAYANTLGIALYRAGDWPAATVALRRAAELSSGGTAFDHYVLAMAYRQLGEFERAHHHLQRGDEWANAQPPHPALATLRDEAAAVVLGGRFALPARG